MEDVLAARGRFDARRPMRPSDCRALAPFPGTNGSMWISSPNMEFVPEPPMHPEGRTFSYFGDGMLGSFEHSKWPQVIYEKEPHAMAAPGNPKLVFSQDLHAFPVHDHLGVLPQFPDPQALWGGFGPDSFERSLELPTEEVGLISEGTTARLSMVALHAQSLALKLAEKWFGSRPLLAGDGVQWRAARINFIKAKLRSVNRTLARFREVPMSSFDALMLYREAQRLILEVQAWIVYIDVIRPRLDDADFRAGRDVLPLRGVFTGRLPVVESLHRVGVPVWWVRPLYTLTEFTQIAAVHEVILPCIYFSSEKVIRHGKHELKAPAWVEAKSIDTTMERFGDLVQRYALSNEPTIQCAIAVLVEDREEPVHQDTDTPVNDDRGSPAPFEADVMDLQQDTEISAEPVLSEVPPRKKQKRGRKATGLPGGGVPSPPKLQKPSWMSAVSKPWEAALAADPKLATPDRARRALYFLPPPPLFYSTGETLTQKVHNWLRIREWSMFQALVSVENRPVLMTIPQWRIALEGRYFAVDYPRDAPCQPQSTLADIACLPPAPEPTSTLGKRPDRDSAAHPPRRARPGADPRRLTRLMERVDIHVRFAVHARLPPYDPDMQPRWMTKPVDRHQAATDTLLWAGITWELSYMNFRMELLALDMEIMPELYDPETFTVSNRQHDIMRIWNDAHVVWEKPGENDHVDRLTADHWWDRRVGMGLFHSILNAWPVVEPRLPPWDGQKETLEGYEDLERATVLYYCRRFRAVRGRLPTVPLARPSGLPPTIPPPEF